MRRDGYRLTIVLVSGLCCVSQPAGGTRLVLRSDTSLLDITASHCLRNTTRRGDLDTLRISNATIQGRQGQYSLNDAPITTNLSRLLGQLKAGEVGRGSQVNRGDLHLIAIRRQPSGWQLEFGIEGLLLGTTRLEFPRVSQTEWHDLLAFVEHWNSRCKSRMIEREKVQLKEEQ